MSLRSVLAKLESANENWPVVESYDKSPELVDPLENTALISAAVGPVKRKEATPPESES